MSSTLTCDVFQVHDSLRKAVLSLGAPPLSISVALQARSLILYFLKDDQKQEVRVDFDPIELSTGRRTGLRLTVRGSEQAEQVMLILVAQLRIDFAPYVIHVNHAEQACSTPQDRAQYQALAHDDTRVLETAQLLSQVIKTHVLTAYQGAQGDQSPEIGSSLDTVEGLLVAYPWLRKDSHMTTQHMKKDLFWVIVDALGHFCDALSSNWSYMKQERRYQSLDWASAACRNLL